MTVAPCTINGCDKPQHSRDLCGTHYATARRKGLWLPTWRVPALLRYWSYVDTSAGPDACWPWTGGMRSGGYGGFDATGAHRWGYEHRIGPIPKGHGILHRCDNPPCQNDRHWFTGTNADNVADKMAKGRQSHVRGEAHARAVLTERDVREIRALFTVLPQWRVVTLTGFSRSIVSRVLLGKTWAHVV